MPQLLYPLRPVGVVALLGYNSEDGGHVLRQRLVIDRLAGWVLPASRWAVPSHVGGVWEPYSGPRNAGLVNPSMGRLVRQLGWMAMICRSGAEAQAFMSPCRPTGHSKGPTGYIRRASRPGYAY